MLDYKLLEALAMVVQEGGFDRAAKALFLTQSAVSQRVRLLEEQAGRVLLARTSPPRPTAAGVDLLRHYRLVSLLERDIWGGMAGPEGSEASALVVGVNADSLATWFLEALGPFLDQERVLLDLRADDQDQTHRLLRDGEAVGCVSARERPMQGCRASRLGRMDYRLTASPSFAARWFPDGLTLEAAGRAPALIFNRQDELLHRLTAHVLGRVPGAFKACYLPSSEKFGDFIAAGRAYGVLPDQQSEALFSSGDLVDLAPGHWEEVVLYWHCWNLGSGLLEDLTRTLLEGAKRLLPQ